MGRKGKFGIFILVILLILFLAGAVIGFYSFNKERLRAIALNEELDNLKAEKRILENKLAQSKERIDKLAAQLETAQSEMKELNSAFQKAKDQKDRLYSKVEKLESKLREEEKIKKEWETKQIQTQKEIDSLQAQVKLLQVSKDELTAELDELKIKDEVALGKIVVEQKKVDEQVARKGRGEEANFAVLAQPPAEPAIKAKILEVNKGYDFAVINLGSRNGLNSGEVFSVYRQGSYIGDIQVEKVREAMSACGFMSKDIKDRIKEGDEVSLSKVVVTKKELISEEVAGKTTSATSGPSQAMPTSEGRVLVVKKEYDFAVINLGRQDGVDIGDVFSVYRDGSYIGDIQVDKTSEIMSACAFASIEVKGKIREGDKAIRK